MLDRRVGRRASRAVWILGIAGAVAGLAACEGPAPKGADQAAAPKPAASETAPAAAPSASAGPVIATYNGKSFTLEDYRAALGSLNARARKSLDEGVDRRRQFIENHILSKLIYDEGVSKGLEKDPEIQRRLDELKQHLVVQQVMEERQNVTVSDEDVKAYYDSHTQEFSTEKVKAAHILVDNEDLAKEILAKLKADPSQFTALAAEHSKDLSNAKRGGDLGMFGRGRMVKEFEDAAFALKSDGEISEPVKTRFGWHIILRTGREDGSVQPFDQVKSQIKVKLVSDRRRDQTQGFLDELKKKSGLALDEKNLAEATSGQAPDAAEKEEAAGGAGH